MPNCCYRSNIRCFMMSTLAAAVRSHRRKAGLSQAGLARLAGVGKTVVFDIERGKETVRLKTLLPSSLECSVL